MRRSVAAAGSAAIAALLVLVTGMLGFSAFFSDRAPGESEMDRSLFLVGVYLVGGTAIGLALPRRWYLSVLAAWGPWLVTIPAILFRSSNGTLEPYLRYLLSGLVGAPLIALLAGYLGSAIRREIDRRRHAPSGTLA